MKRSDNFFDDDDKKFSIGQESGAEGAKKDLPGGRKKGRKNGPPGDFPNDFPSDFPGGFPGGWHGGPPKMPLKERVILWIAVIFWVVLILGVFVVGPIYRKHQRNANPKPAYETQVTVTPTSGLFPEWETEEEYSAKIVRFCS